MSTTPTSKVSRLGILLVDHGSRRHESNEQLETLAARLRDFSATESLPALVAAAHMEIALPTVAEAFSSLVTQGATRVVVLPCFLARGKHVTEDIPVLLDDAARNHAGVPYVLAPPLSEHVGFVELLLAAAQVQVFPNE